MKVVRQLVKCVKELDKEDEVKIGFSSVIDRSDRNPEKEIVDFKLKLERYWESNQFLFIDNDNIGKSCLNNSKLHLNQKGTIKKVTLWLLKFSNTAKKFQNSSTSRDIYQILFELRDKNINFVRNKYENFIRIINENEDIFATAGNKAGRFFFLLCNLKSKVIIHLSV